MRLKKSKLLIVTLVVIACLVSIFEIPVYAAGSTMGTAEVIYPDTTITGYYSNNDIFYRMDLDKSGCLRLNAKGSDDYLIHILDKDGDVEYHDRLSYDGNKGYYTDYSVIYLDAGTHYIKIFGYASSSYEINVTYEGISETVPESLTNRNDYIENAPKMSLNKTITGVMARYDYAEQDFYKFTLGSRTDIKFSSKTNNSVECKYFILDKDGNTVDYFTDQYDSNKGYCYHSEVGLTLGEGTYYVKVKPRNTIRNGCIYKFKISANIKVSSIKMSKTSLALDMLGTKSATLKATVSPSNASKKALKWTSSNTKVAKVSSDGKVTAVGGGTATIYAKATDGSGKAASCKVTVKGIPGVTYSTHVQSYGWQSWRKNGTMAGTSGEAKRLEGIKIKLTDKRYSGGIRYTTHVQSYGWLDNPSNSATWAQNGEMSGTTGQGKRLEAIRIKLYGTMAEKYDVYYRVHAQSYGWLGWAKNGTSSGTAGKGKRLEAIQIVLVKKGGSAPPRTYKGITSNTSKAFIK